MKKLTQLLGVFATGLISAVTVAGCASTPDAMTGPMTTAGTGGTGTGGSTGAGGGTQLVSPNTFTVLLASEFTAGPTPAPAAWTGSASCSTCHGANGEGVASIGPEIRHVPATYATWVVRHGRLLPNGMASAMSAFPLVAPDAMTPAISDADLTAVLAWLDGQPKATTGVALYRDFCGNCHGPKVASGGAVAISVIGKMKTEISQKVRMGEGTDPSMRNGYMPAEDMTALTEAELDLIKAYLMGT